jgi:hypothetical protein
MVFGDGTSVQDGPSLRNDLPVESVARPLVAAGKGQARGFIHHGCVVSEDISRVSHELKKRRRQHIYRNRLILLLSYEKKRLSIGHQLIINKKMNERKGM